jgi:hypothetical protein
MATGDDVYSGVAAEMHMFCPCYVLPFLLESRSYVVHNVPSLLD